ncbi:hypothetical protein [Usitatibacter palustris]|uniref:Uncharacterized protein n=1 Tax=Usitatibacter palustris TaxID=2732487 RepID=A0A6M4H7X1_9PROT|nr:hypothetical protein [Usitatibacter palustris]QJR14968.1 hypothetical protein DSM104440_01783 [Usitatibacter palustris]
MSPRRFLALLAILVASSALAQERPWRFVPADPVVGEDFIVMALGSTPTLGAYVDTSSLNFLNGTYQLTAHMGVRSDFSVSDGSWATGAMQAAAAGTFPVRFTQTGGGLSGRSYELGTITIAPTVVAPDPAYRNLSGNWFFPGEDGWGFNLIQSGAGRLSGVWMTYQPVAAEPTPYMTQRGATYGAWYFMPSGRWVTPTHFRGLLYETTGPPVGEAFDRSTVYSVARGMATFTIVSGTELDFVGDITVGGSAITPPSRPGPNRIVRKRLVRLDP